MTLKMNGFNKIFYKTKLNKNYEKDSFDCFGSIGCNACLR